MAATIQTIEKPTKARALDTSGNNNHGQIYSGRALEFDGVSDYLATGYGSGLNPTTESIVCAIWAEANSSSQILGYVTNGSNQRFYVGRYLSNWDFGIQGSSWGGAPASGALVKAELHTWYRVVLVADSNTNVATLYVNGVATATKNYTSFTLAANMAIGFNADTSYLWDGMLSDAQIWNATWTADDVLYDYNNPEQLVLNRGGTSLTESNLKLWYPMNDGHRGQQSYILDAANTGLGDNVVVNGTFDTDSDWTKGSGWSISDGKAIFSGSAFASLTPSSAPLISGKVYKITLDATVTNGSFKLQHNSVDIITESTSGSYTAYITSAATTFNIARASVGVQNDFTIDNIVVKPINDKNHATTVFYGDELITNGTMEADSNWADYNSVNANVRSSTQAHSGTYSRKFTVDDASQGIQSDTFTTVTGRKYLLSFEIYPDDATTARIAIRKGDNSDWADDTSFSGLTQDAWNTKTVTYTESAGGSGAYLVVHGHGNTSGDFYVDDVSIKEVGTATGWTDADQQLDIPQTALQSFNQLAWFSDNQGSSNPHASTSHHDDFNPGTGDFTVSVWVFQSDTIDDNYLFAKGGGGASGWHLRIDPNGDFDFAVEDDDGSNNGTQINANAATVISPGKWYHCVAVIDRTADNTYLYLNGELVETEDISALNNPITHSSGTLKLGSWGTTYSGGTMNGTATEFSIFKGIALNQSQVNELYNDGKALDATTHSQSSYLKGYWRNNGLATWQDLTSYNLSLIHISEPTRPY